MIDILAANHSVIAVDRRGHGRSTYNADDVFTFDMFASDTHALLQSENITSAFWVLPLFPSPLPLPLSPISTLKQQLTNPRWAGPTAQPPLSLHSSTLPSHPPSPKHSYSQASNLSPTPTRHLPTQLFIKPSYRGVQLSTLPINLLLTSRILRQRWRRLRGLCPSGTLIYLTSCL